MEQFGGVITVLTLLSSCLLLQHLSALENEVNEVKCEEIKAGLKPCMGYATGKEKEPPAPCCDGVKKIADATGKAPEDKKGVCECIKNATKGVKDVDYARISGIPKACKIQVNFPPMQNNTDCKTIKLVGNSLW